MQITFGLLLDGEQGWRPANRLGKPILGPLGFLNLLETRLGLLRAECAHAQRVTQYRECLKRCDTPDRFYHASFGIDPIGVSAAPVVARRLVSAWLERPITIRGGRPDRRHCRCRGRSRSLLVPSIGERLVRVAEFLARQQSKIEGVALVDPMVAFPKRWREVLAKGSPHLALGALGTRWPARDSTDGHALR